jgi:hypothetical protein
MTEPTLEALFDRWNAISERERDDPTLIPPPRSIKYDWQNAPTFAEFLAVLPSHVREKAEVMHAILTRLNAYKPESWVRSQILENYPQLDYFLLKRFIELSIFQSDFHIRPLVAEVPPLPVTDPVDTIATRLQHSGATHADVLQFAQEIARVVLDRFVGVLNGLDLYGDLPRNVAHPRLTAPDGEFMDGLYTYLWDTVLNPTAADEADNQTE